MCEKTALGTNLGEKLVDNRVANACAVVARATLLADGIELIKDDDVEFRVVALGLVLDLGILEQIPDVFLRLADKLVQDLGTCDARGCVG